MNLRTFIFIAITAVSVQSVYTSASAQTICPTTAIANGNPVDATLVASWFSCKAPSDNPVFTGNVGIGTATLASTFTVENAGATARTFTFDSTQPNGVYGTFSNSGIAIGDIGVGSQLFSGGGVGDFGLTSRSGKLVFGTSSAQRMTIDASGNVGIGLTNPTSRLQVASDSYPTYINLDNANSRLFVGSVMIGELNSGNVEARGSYDLVLRTDVGNALVVKHLTGHVGVLTASPSQALEVNGQVQVDSLASASSINLCITGSSGGVISSCSSSIRYKENVHSASFGLSEVMAMRPVTFKWKGRNENDFGLVAEEVAKINPEFVTYRGGNIEGVKYPQMTAVLIGAVKAQQAEIADLRAANARLMEAGRRLQAQEAGDIQTLMQQIAELRGRMKIRMAQK